MQLTGNYRCFALWILFSILFFAAPLSAKTQVKELTIVFTGDNIGFVEPCDCSPPKGGLVWRAAMIDKIRKENKNVVVVDCGDMFSSSKKPVALRTKTIAEAMAMMKYDAINIGEEELNSGLDSFIQTAKKHRLPFVSANIDINNGSQELIKPYIMKEFKGLKVGITGATPPSFFNEPDSLGKSVRFEDSNESLIQNVKKLRENKADVVIALIHMGEEASRNFLEYNDASGITIAVAGHGRYIGLEAKKIKDSYLVQNSTSGEYVGLLKVTLDEKNRPVDVKLENVPLKELPGDKGMSALIKKFDEESSKTTDLMSQ